MKSLFGESGKRAYIIAELGINHNGSVDIAKRLVEAAADAGADAVKLQKRTLEAVYAPEDLDRPRKHPLGGPQTNRRQKEALELDRTAWEVVAMHARALGMECTGSPWDPQAVCDIVNWVRPSWLKIASATLANQDRETLVTALETGLPLVVSTGMCDHMHLHWLKDLAFEVLGDVETLPILPLVCTSAYPAENNTLNLQRIHTLRSHFGRCGYSGHERGIATTVAARCYGARVIERHLTLDRTMYGSDQSASLEPQGFRQLVRDIRAVEEATGSYEVELLPGDEEMAKKLRRWTL